MDVYNETAYFVFVKSRYYLYTIRYDKIMTCKQADNDLFLTEGVLMIRVLICYVVEL